MKYLLTYDDACGPCTRFRNVIGFLDARRRMDYAGLDEAERLGRLDSVPASRRHRSFHLVSPDGEARSGASALPLLAALIPGGKPLAAVMRVPPVYAGAAFVYAVFSRLHDSGSCRYSPSAPSPSGEPRNLIRNGASMVLAGVTGQVASR